GDDVEQRGLARAVGPDQPGDAALGNGKIDATQHLEAIESAAQVGQLEKRHAANIERYCVRAYSRNSMSWMPPAPPSGTRIACTSGCSKKGAKAPFRMLRTWSIRVGKRSASLV